LSKKITLEDLLTMTSGLDCVDNVPPGQPTMEQSANWVDFSLDRPMAAAPGTRFNYCSEVSQVISAALQQAIGMSTRAYANQVLFPPMGIAPVPEERWTADPHGVTVTIGILSLQTLAQALAQPRQDPLPLPMLAETVSGKSISFDKNPLGWKTLSLTFTAGQAEASASFVFATLQRSS
jgi:CubicO group peptidase (beta-lactamase class C family)